MLKMSAAWLENSSLNVRKIPPPRIRTKKHQRVVKIEQISIQDELSGPQLRCWKGYLKIKDVSCGSRTCGYEKEIQSGGSTDEKDA
jgi:hypothetical protein